MFQEKALNDGISISGGHNKGRVAYDGRIRIGTVVE
jgi:hypothetical protein